ncbi:YihY/virulence factor BrkB family protein [Actinomyces lilanjuaniae]|uniref:YihY/virulence factor BrkB family protein n=1 Tax=Actinomyces lilanjuaniae TaxID=2321394 RepID=UPI001FAA0D92|nr:YihY/virulence factor BrkB family protein [Actinomyces lilanjuaniae]
MGRLRCSRVGRALERYQEAHGNLIAGGIAYTGLFSVFAALAIGVSALMAFVGSHDSVRRSVVTTIDSLLPGVVDTGSGGLVTVDQLVLDSALTVGSVLAVAALMFSAMSLMGAIRTGLRAVFTLTDQSTGLVRTQLMNLVGFVIIVVGVLVTAVASVLTRLLSGEAGQALGLSGALTSTGSRVAVLVVSFVIDSGILALLVRVSGARPPRRDLLWGSALGALALGVLRELGTDVVGSSASNPLLASFAAVAVLLLWLNLAARVVLLTAAWMAEADEAPAEGSHRVPPDEASAQTTKGIRRALGAGEGH